MTATLHPYCYRPGSSLYPARVQCIYTKMEDTMRGGEVERTYVQGLRWNVKHEEVLPMKCFLKDVNFGIAVTDDVDRFLRQKRIWRR